MRCRKVREAAGIGYEVRLFPQYAKHVFHAKQVAAALCFPLFFVQTAAQAAVSVEIGDAAPVQQSAIAVLTAEAEREYEVITKSLGMTSLPDIRIVVTRAFEGIEVEISQSYPELLLILIPPHIIQRRLVPLAHELTHVIAGPAVDDVLSEGLAVYYHERFGADPAFPNFGDPLDHALPEALKARYGTQDVAAAVEAFSREFGSATDKIVTLSSWIYEIDDQDARSLAYIVAGSYVRFLIETMLEGDTRKFLELYRSGDYRSALGISADETWDRWLKTLPEVR